VFLLSIDIASYFLIILIFYCANTTAFATTPRLYGLTKLDATTPRLYRLPKLHKENIPLRPIVSFTYSPTYGLATELSSLLKPLIGKSKHHVRKSSDFASSIAYELLQTDEIIHNGLI